VSRRRGPTPPRRWQQMQRAEAVARSSAAEAVRQALGYELPEMWGNDRYNVSVGRDAETGDVTHLSVHRRDRKPIMDWRDLQRIKDDVAGPTVEAVELYPARARVVDTANERHLWCFRPGAVLPFGFPEGLVIDAGEGPQIGSVQRPFEGDDLTEGFASEATREHPLLRLTDLLVAGAETEGR